MDGSPPNSNVELVQLDQDHPGFRDRAYRERRNEIADQALSYRFGDPEPRILYSPIEHSVWQVVMEHLAPLHARYACREYLAGRAQVFLTPTSIPQLSEINAALAHSSRFRLSPVAGLVTPRTFLTYLAEGVFLSTQYVRHESAPLYTPEPDVIHELVGHAPLLGLPALARLHRLFGEATSLADEALTEKIIRVYWYTFEFGLVREAGALKAIGAGLLSSYGELGRFEDAALLRPFDLEEIAETPFDPTAYQHALFVAPSTDALISELTRWLLEPPR